MHRKSPALLAGEKETEARAGPAAHRAWPWMAPLLLAALALASRAPWRGSAGEPDCARYLMGVMQWLGAGSGAPYIYAKVLSPGYYATAVWVVRHTGAAAAGLLSQASLWAAVASAPLLYWIGRQFTGETAAFAGTALYLLTPGFWWLGLETHPQGVSFLFFLLALACYLPTRRPGARVGMRTLAAAVILGAGLLLKNDLILLSGIFPALQLRPLNWRRVWGALAVPGGGLTIFFLGRQAALGLAWSAAQQQTTTEVREFLSWPHGTWILKQVLPLLTAPGLATLGLTMVALGWGYASHRRAGAAWRQRWNWLLAAWVIPQLGFWLAIRGNNARHMAAYILLPLWAALDWVVPQLRRGRHPEWTMTAVCVLALAANALLIPPSSNTTLFPSGNVPASRRDLAARMDETRAWLDARLTAAPSACFLGNPTLPYLELALLQAQPGAALDHEGAVARHVLLGRSRWSLVGGLRLGAAGARSGRGASKLPRVAATRFIEVNSPAEFRRAAAACGRGGAAAWSLEYTPTGLHQLFFGKEIANLPLLRRWYPGGRARPQLPEWKTARGKH